MKKSRFANGEHMAHLVRFWFWVQFSSVDIACQSSAKQSESTSNSRIWEPLALLTRSQKFRRVAEISFCKEGTTVLNVECWTIRINAKQQDLASSGLRWHNYKDMFLTQVFNTGIPCRYMNTWNLILWQGWAKLQY